MKLLKYFISIGILTIIVYFLFFKVSIKNVTINDFEIDSKIALKDLNLKTKNCSLNDENEEIILNNIGKNEFTVDVKNRFGKKKSIKFIVNAEDKEKPVINGVKDLSVVVNNEADLLKDIEVLDNSKENIKAVVKGTYDLSKEGTYELLYEAEDSSGNITKEKFNLVVIKEPEKIKADTNSKYYIKVNKTLNVVMIYEKNSKNDYSLIKTMLCSTGENTPVGLFTTTDKYETLSLVGGVWGHYTMRITGPIWFHSVPYFSKPTENNPYWNDLEYEEYNKLGTSASLGCVRLSTIDAKWIYENILWHTPVEIFESDTLPAGVIKPEGIKIDITSDNKGWDPTDPDSNNPWNK